MQLMTNLHQKPILKCIHQILECLAVKQFLISKTGYLFHFTSSQAGKIYAIIKLENTKMA